MGSACDLFCAANGLAAVPVLQAHGFAPLRGGALVPAGLVTWLADSDLGRNNLLDFSSNQTHRRTCTRAGHAPGARSGRGSAARSLARHVPLHGTEHTDPMRNVNVQPIQTGVYPR